MNTNRDKRQMQSTFESGEKFHDDLGFIAHNAKV